MPTYPANTIRVIESIRTFTAERDRDALVHALLRTLVDVLPVRAVELRRRGDHNVLRCETLRAGRSRGVPPAGERDRMRAALNQALVSSPVESGTTPSGDGWFMRTVEDSSGVSAVLAVEVFDGEPVQQLVLDALIAIYLNLLGVIDDSQRDTLTGLLNRKTFDQTVQAAIVNAGERAPEADAKLQRISVLPATAVCNKRLRSRPAESRHWLAILDIDHFKRINDTFGHLYGDEVLILLARLVSKSFRDTDRIFRLGGEEFGVVLADCAPHEASVALERCRAAIEAHDFPQVGRVTISIGYAELSNNDVTAAIVARADDALYASKHAGRNRVSLAAGADAAVKSNSSIDLF